MTYSFLKVKNLFIVINFHYSRQDLESEFRDFNKLYLIIICSEFFLSHYPHLSFLDLKNIKIM